MELLMWKLSQNARYQDTQQSSLLLVVSTLQKELQGLVGFGAYRECQRKGESSTQAVLQASTISQYFGMKTPLDLHNNLS